MSLLCHSLEESLAGYTRRTTETAGHVAAAVLLPLFVHHGKEHLLLTRRTDTLRDHKGQICFPGGAAEPHDPDRQWTALREAQEEVGIRPQDVQVLGVLDDLVTHSGYHITPYVARIPWPYALHCDAREVAEVLELPLEDLTNPRNQTQGWLSADRHTLIHFYRSGPHTVWGITGWILKNLLDVIAP